MPRPKATIAVALGLLLLLAVLSQLRPDGYTRIELTDESGRKILSLVAEDEERLTLTWRNSLFDLLVTEVFFTRGGLLVEDRVTFAATDGSPPPQVSARDVDDLFQTGGAFAASGLNRPFSRIVYRIGAIGDPKLAVKNRTIALKQEAGFGGKVILSANVPHLYEVLLARWP
jgi:hypothetical protein